MLAIYMAYLISEGFPLDLVDEVFSLFLNIGAQRK